MRRRWKRLEWIERFGYGVCAGFVAVIVTLALMTMLVGCDPGGHTELPPLTGPHDTFDATGIVSPSFTAATTTTVVLVTPPPTPPWDNAAPVPTIIVPAPTQAPQRPRRARTVSVAPTTTIAAPAPPQTPVAAPPPPTPAPTLAPTPPVTTAAPFRPPTTSRPPRTTVPRTTVPRTTVPRTTAKPPPTQGPPVTQPPPPTPPGT